MRISKSLFILFLLINLTNLLAQNTPNKELSLYKGSISENFEFIQKKSSNYQNYKVVKKVWLRQLEKHVSDSIHKLKNDLVNTITQVKDHQKTIDNLKSELQALNTQLTDSENSKESIDFIGMTFKKKTYKTLVWSIFAFLLLALAYFVYRLNEASQITKKTLIKHDELEEEYNSYRTRALEREQILNRKLQDEINKQKKS